MGFGGPGVVYALQKSSDQRVLANGNSFNMPMCH